MITEDYVSFETAKLLKEKGFDEDIDLWYDENGEMFFQCKYDINRDWRVRANQEVYECPTLQMAMKWLREFFKLNIEVFTYWTKDKSAVYGNRVVRDNSIVKDVETAYNTYEQACESAIKWCLENVI